MEKTIDPSQSFLDFPEHPLKALFQPKTVALIGATDKDPSVAHTLWHNLASFTGRVYPVNPKRSTIFGQPCYSTIAALPEEIDLALIATPAATVPSVIAECAQAKTKTAVVISAGFKERGAQGAALEQKVVETLKRSSLRIIGPNCLGIQNPWHQLNATFARGMALPGSIAFISQSGAMCTSVLDWSFKAQIGFSAFVSIGSMADVNWGDLIDYFGSDPKTDSILIYMETIGNPRAFLSAAKEVALTKPLIVIKAGRTKAAALAAASHTGALAGSDDVFDAAMKRVGILRVDTIEELFDMARLVATQPRPKGPRLAIVTNAGGPAVLATDAAVMAGASIAKLSTKTVQSLDAILPAAWSHQNPVDVLGDADAVTYGQALNIVAQDENADGLLAILSPQDMTKPEEVATVVAKLNIPGKPLLASWMGGKHVEKGYAMLEESGVATFAFPDNAARLFARMWEHSKSLAALYETPKSHIEILPREDAEKRRAAAHALFETALQEKRLLLTEEESKRLLRLYGIPTVATEHVASSQAAIEVAEKMGYPVVVKLHSKTVTHKSDIGGVRLNITSADEVKKAFDEIKVAAREHFEGVTVQPMIKHEGCEVILGSFVDEQFGAVVLFGMGGQLVEVFKDRALALPPLTSTLAKQLIEKTAIYKALLGVRGRAAVNMDALEKIVVSFSQMIADQPLIKECDINPLLSSSTDIIALDARIILGEAKGPPFALRPYPSEFVFSWKVAGEEITIRPICPEDEPLLVKFHESLSEESVRRRYMSSLSLSERVRHQRLVRLCCSDFDRDIAFVALHEGHIIALARLMRIPGLAEALFVMTVADKHQNRGLGRRLLDLLLQVARQEKIVTVRAAISKDNAAMLALCQKAGFRLNFASDVVQATRSTS